MTFEDKFINRDQAISQGTPTHCFDLPPQCLVQYWSQKFGPIKDGKNIDPISSLIGLKNVEKMVGEKETMFLK